MKSKTGLTLAGIYILIAAYFIITQGLFGESFIALTLGMPWVLLLAYFEFFNAPESVMPVLVIAPMVLNIFVFYWIGSLLGRLSSKVS